MFILPLVTVSQICAPHLNVTVSCDVQAAESLAKEGISAEALNTLNEYGSVGVRPKIIQVSVLNMVVLVYCLNRL